MQDADGTGQQNPKRSWSCRFVGQARVARLRTAISTPEKTIGLRLSTAEEKDRVVLQQAQSLLADARSALANGDLNTGWALVLEADRWAVEAETPEELQARAVRLRAEVREKLSGWRQVAALTALGDAGAVTSVSGIREALRIRDEHTNNLYHKFELVADQLSLVGLFLLVGLVAILLASWANIPPLDVYTTRLGWAALLGGVGGLLSAARGIATGAQRKIPDQIADWPVTLARPVLGAVAGVASWLVVNAGLVTLGAKDNELASLVVAFASGFSESYFLSLLPSSEK